MADDTERDDIRSAREQMTTKFGGKRELARLASYVDHDERVLRMATGHYGKGMGLIVVTDRRLLFVMDGMMNKQTEDFSYLNINSVAWQAGMGSGTVIVSSGGTRAEIKNVNKQDGKMLVDQARDVLSWHQQQRHHTPAASPAPPAPAPPAGGGGPASELAQAAELHRTGILTDTEFAALKAKILS